MCRECWSGELRVLWRLVTGGQEWLQLRLRREAQPELGLVEMQR